MKVLTSVSKKDIEKLLFDLRLHDSKTATSKQAIGFATVLRIVDV